MGQSRSIFQKERSQNKTLVQPTTTLYARQRTPEEIPTKIQKTLENPQNYPKKSEKLQNLHKKTIEKTKSKKNINTNEMITEEVVIDTAAGIHLVNDRKWLHDFSEISLQSPYFGCGEYNPIDIVGEGYLAIKAGNKDTTRVHAYYAPNETASIISADKLNEETGLTLIND